MKVGNIVALLRVGLLPVIIYLLSLSTKVAESWAIGLLVLALVSEFFHGYFKKKGEVGSFLDPFSHKIFVIGLLLMLYLQGFFHGGFLLVFIVRDVAVAIIKWLGARDDAIVKRDYFGKAMVYLQFGIIFSILLTEVLGYFVLDRIAMIFTLFSVVMAGLSVIHNYSVYIRKFR